MSQKLTDEQRKLWEKYIPYSCKVAADCIRSHPRLTDDAVEQIYAAARSAGEVAVRKWDPARGTYVTCLHWWTLAAIAKALRQHFQDYRLLSLDSERAESKQSLYNQLLGEAVDPERETLRRSVWVRAMDELPKRLSAKGMSEDKAREDVSLYLRCLTESQTEVAEELGWSRQRLNNRIMRMQPTFERWAAELRKEAA